MYLHGCPWTSFKYLFPKCTCIDAIRQVPISKMYLHGCPWTFFVKYLFPKMARLSTDVLCQVPICRIRPHGRHLSSTCFQKEPALTLFVKYLFPKCAFMDVSAVHGHPSSSTYLQNSPAWLSMDLLRQIPISKMHLQCCSRTSFVKYQFPKCTCMAFNGHPSSLTLGTSALCHSTWGQRRTLKAGLYGYERSSKYLGYKRPPPIYLWAHPY